MERNRCGYVGAGPGCPSRLELSASADCAREVTHAAGLNQLLQFLQQGISAIFRFVQLIWTWSVGQISSLLQVPWQSWPLWKLIVLALVIGGVAWALYKAAKELWEAGERILGAFATLLGVLVRTLPRVLVAGVIALGGVWLLNNLDLSRVAPSFLRTSLVDRR